MTRTILLTEPIAETGMALLRTAGEVHVAGTTDETALRPLLAAADASSCAPHR